MKLTIRFSIAVVFFMALAIIAHAQDNSKIDESNLVTQILGIENLNPAQADSYLTDKKFILSSRSTKNLGEYNAEFIKYKIADGIDSYSIVAVKEKIINTMYITYSKEMYLKTLDEVLKMGFKQVEAANPDPAQSVYARNNERFLVRITPVKEKTFYVMGVSNLLLTAKAISDAKSH